MAKTQLNVRVDEGTAQAARERALARGVSVNRYIEELVQRDAAEVGRSFVDAAADFMKSHAPVFAEELDAAGAGERNPGSGAGGPPAA
ncbi:toxin-antitoxin system HicB family antitoxin [Streptomyces sp. NPDC007083]|uniref:toxin-antitoxin system HicB family antitoxin n=1 Tax=unclassified Streptomyces TaxID=2593676 RepID=UPI0034018A77